MDFEIGVTNRHLLKLRELLLILGLLPKQDSADGIIGVL